MKKNRFLVILSVLFLGVALALTGCGGKKSDNSGGNSNADGDRASEVEDYMNMKIEVNPDLKGKVVMWGPMVQHFENVVVEFNKYYPNVEVELINQGLDTKQKAQTAIAAGKGGPDIIQIVWQEMNTFLASGGLVDLFELGFEKHLPNYNPADINRFRSFDGTKMLFFPFNRELTVTYYRYDILEDYGYPTDPVELGDYLADKENWLNMARTFKADGKWIFEWNQSPVWHYAGDQGFFDRDLNFTRNNEKFLEYFDISKQLAQEGLASGYLMTWDPRMYDAMNSGEVVMVYTDGGMSQQELVNYVPDTAGKWMMTRFPNGDFVGGNATGYAILEQSKNKEAAYAFLEFALTTPQGLSTLTATNGHLAVYKPFRESEEYQSRKDDWLGGQQTIKFMVEHVAPYVPDPFYTPLDGTARDIFNAGLDNAIANNIDSQTALNQIQADIEAAVSIQKQDLLKLLEN